MTTPAVTFNYAAWVAAFPEFAGVSETMATGYFSRAGLYCANDTLNPAFGAGVLPALLDLLTCHVAWMSAPRDANGRPASTGQPPSPIVGRVSSATEGSVIVAAEYNTGGSSPSEAFFVQTSYGAQFWQASAQFRTMRYSPRRTFVASGVFPYYPGAVR